VGRGGRSLVGGVGWLGRVRLVSGCSEAPQVPRRGTSRGWFAGLRPEGPVRGQSVGGELPQVDRGGPRVQRRIVFRNSAVADLAEPRGDPGDGPFDHRPVRPVGGPQRPVVSPPTAVCPLKLVMLVHRDAAASGGRGAQIREKATGAGSPELRDPGLDGETDVSSVAKSAAPAAASPVPGPVAFVNDTAVMIPVSGSATTCALKPSWRRSRVVCACRVSGSTVEMTRSWATCRAICHHRLPGAFGSSIHSTSCPAINANNANVAPLQAAHPQRSHPPHWTRPWCPPHPTGPALRWCRCWSKWPAPPTRPRTRVSTNWRRAARSSQAMSG